MVTICLLINEIACKNKKNQQSTIEKRYAVLVFSSFPESFKLETSSQLSSRKRITKKDVVNAWQVF